MLWHTFTLVYIHTGCIRIRMSITHYNSNVIFIYIYIKNLQENCHIRQYEILTCPIWTHASSWHFRTGMSETSSSRAVPPTQVNACKQFWSVLFLETHVTSWLSSLRCSWLSYLRCTVYMHAFIPMYIQISVCVCMYIYANHKYDI